MSTQSTGARGLFRGLWRGFRRNGDLRASIHRLRQLDDHTLRDIGLRRDDIEAAVRGGRFG